MDVIRLNASRLSLLDQIAPDVFDGPVRPESAREFVECPRHIMLLAVEGGQVIGMVSGVEYFHPDKPRQFWVNEIGVTPDRRNEGIGRRLLRDIISLAQSRGCQYAWLGTETTNIPANRCFSSLPASELPQEFLLYEWTLETTHDAARVSDTK